MSRQDPWSEFLDRLLVTASLSDAASAPTVSGRLPADDDSAGTATSTAKFDRAAPLRATSPQTISESGPLRD